MVEPVADTLLGNPVFAGLAAFSATSVALAAVSWLAGPAMDCRKEQAGRLDRGGRPGLSGRHPAGRWAFMSRRPRWPFPRARVGERALSTKEMLPETDRPMGSEDVAIVDFEALQRELDEAFAPVRHGRRKP